VAAKILNTEYTQNQSNRWGASEAHMLTYKQRDMSPSWEDASCAATQEFPNILWNLTVHYRVHKIPSLVPIHSQINPVHTTPSYQLCLGLSSSFFPYGVPIQILYALLFSPICATCPAHLILLDLITLIILGEEYKLWSTSLRSFLQPPVTSSPFDPILNTLFSNTLSLCSSLNVRDQVSYLYRTTDKIIVFYIPTFPVLGGKWEDKKFWLER
jgi:hypothetical protein